MTQTLTFPRDNFDATADFKIAGVLGACYLFCAATHPDFKDDQPDADHDKIFVMQHAAVLKSHYSEKDVADRERFAALAPIAQGEEVEVDGKRYKLHINGNYSDAGYLIPINQ